MVCTRSRAHDLMADYCFPCSFLTEPNAPPANVNGYSVSSTSIFVSWGDVPISDQNGVIVSYTVTYRRLASGPAQTKSVSAPAHQTTLTGLNEFTNYSITVFASTSKGGGNESTPIVIITDEDSKFVITEFAYRFVGALHWFSSPSSHSPMWCLVMLR